MATAKTKAASAARQKNATTAPDAPPAATLGQQLRTAREARDLTLDMVADELMIRKYYLECLEDGAYRQLPERVYAVGFVNNYAQLVGLDPDHMVDQFKREAYGGRGVSTARVELTMPAPVSQSLLPSRHTLIVIGALLVLLIVGGIVWNTRQPAKLDNATPPPPAATADDLSLNSVPADTPAPAVPVPDKTAIVSGSGTITTDNPDSFTAPAAPTPAAPDVTPAKASVTEPATAPAPAMPAPAATTPAAPAAASAPAANVPQGTRILVEALQPSWVEIADAEGNILFTNILRVGQALPIPNKPGITLTTGNAAGVQIILDGKKLGALGKTGEVKRAITLEPARLGSQP